MPFAQLRLAALLVGTIACASTQARACGNGKILFEDDFSTLDPAWGLTAGDTVAVGSSGLKMTQKPDTERTVLNQSGLYQDSQICVSVAIESQPGDQPFYGVMFWGVDNSNYYEVEAAPPTATYSVGREQNGRFLKPVPWTDTKVFKQPISSLNDITITLSGRHAVVEINGTRVVQFNGQPPDGGGLIGLDFISPKVSKSPATITVQRIEVRALPRSQ